MALINTVQLEQAQGAVKEGYDMFMEKIGIIPKPIELLSASPALFELQLRRVHYYSQHPKLSFALLAHIRYLVAHNLSFHFCTDFNKYFLKKLGLEEEDLRRLEADPSQSLLEKNESAMLAFVVNAVKSPGSVTAEDIDRLRELGWQDSDIMDALAHGAGMIEHAVMGQVFQMDQNCLVD